MRRHMIVLALALIVKLGLVGCAAHPPLPPQALELNRTGAEALAAGDFETAAARLALAIEYSPRFTEAWVNLGLLQLQRGEVEASRRTLQRARQLNPNLPTPHHALALWFEGRDRAPDAEKLYRAALKVDPGFAPARANLARLLYRRAAWEDAREQFLRLTEVAPESLDGHVGLVETYLRIGREDDADAALDHALASFGDRPELALLGARRLIRRGDFARAERALLALTESGAAERRAAAYGFLAVARLGRGAVRSANETARVALALDARQDVARYVLETTE